MSLTYTIGAQEDNIDLEPTYTLPPRSPFILGPLQKTNPSSITMASMRDTDVSPFSFIVLDPPWPNRSVERSSSYKTLDPRSMEELKSLILDMHLDTHLYDNGHVAVWITNKPACRDLVVGSGGLFDQWGIEVVEEWIWLKVTKGGEPVTAISGLWRRPYEVCIVGQKRSSIGDGAELPVAVDVARQAIRQRVLIGVPDLHSRKPCLKSLVEESLLSKSAAPAQTWGIEVFGRYCVAEWMTIGDQAILFNRDDQWSNVPLHETAASRDERNPI